MVIRDANESDVVGIANLHAESWRATYRGILSDDYLENHAHQDRLAVWQDRLARTDLKPMFVIVADIGSQLAAFACVFPEEDAVFGSFLDNLHVAPHLTGQGLGRQLLSEIARRLLKNGSHMGLCLWVIEQNRRARQFYERAGAMVVGSATKTSPDGQSVVALRCYWTDPANLLP
jgi:GNAT superfamily N-acetyltransferase